MKCKLAIVIPSFRGGGAERVMINIANNLDRNKFDLKLIVIQADGPFRNKVAKDIDIINLNANRVRYSIIKLVSELNNLKPDIIFSTLGHLNLALLIIRKILKGSPRIIVREANTPSISLMKLPKMKCFLMKQLYKVLYPTADIIVAQCEDMKEDIVQSFVINESKIICIYNPVDTKIILSESTKFNPYISKYVNIVAVGRLTYQKGFDILIRAFKIVKDKVPKAKLTILGDGELKDDLIRLTKYYGLEDSIEITGFKNNPYPYYKYADLYVLSSRWEGFPNTLLEALTCGTKVVATNCKSGPREILGKNSECDTLVPVDDYKFLAKRIIEVIYSKTSNGINIEDNYDISKIIRKYEKVFMQL